MNKLPLITPGEILYEEFIKPMDITRYKLAKDIKVPATRIGEIIKGKRRITAETAIKLGHYFGMSAGFWINLQNHYDLEISRASLADELKTIPTLTSK